MREQGRKVDCQVDDKSAMNTYPREAQEAGDHGFWASEPSYGLLLLAQLLHLLPSLISHLFPSSRRAMSVLLLPRVTTSRSHDSKCRQA